MALLEPPSWLNEEFLKHALEESNYESKIDIISFAVFPGVPAGNNFASEIYKIKVQYKIKSTQSTKETSLIVKMPLKDGVSINVVTEGRLHEKEIMFYNEYFPLMKTIPIATDILPERFPSIKPDVLVLEDLGREGYILRNKYDQLDFEHSAAVLQCLANFHATSVALNKMHAELIKQIGVASIFDKNSHETKRYMQGYFIQFAKEIVKWKGYEGFAEIAAEMSEDFWERLDGVLQRRPGLNVLCHGDAWTSNMLFKYDENGQFLNLKLIDFQLIMYGSVGLDLQFFIWVCVDPSVRAHKMAELYSVYLNTLNSCFEQYGCDERLSREELEEEMKFTWFFGYFSIAFVLAEVYSAGDAQGDGNENKPYSAFGKSIYKTNAKQMLDQFEGNGFISKK